MISNHWQPEGVTVRKVLPNLLSIFSTEKYGPYFSRVVACLSFLIEIRFIKFSLTSIAYQGLVAELPPKLARAPAGRGDFDPRMGGYSEYSQYPGYLGTTYVTWYSFRTRSKSFPESFRVSKIVLVQ